MVAQVSDAATESALICNCLLLFFSKVQVNKTAVSKNTFKPSRDPRSVLRHGAALNRVGKAVHSLQQQHRWCSHPYFLPMMGVAMVLQHTLPRSSAC